MDIQLMCTALNSIYIESIEQGKLQFSSIEILDRKGKNIYLHASSI